MGVNMKVAERVTLDAVLSASVANYLLQEIVALIEISAKTSWST